MFVFNYFFRSKIRKGERLFDLFLWKRRPRTSPETEPPRFCGLPFIDSWIMWTLFLSSCLYILLFNSDCHCSNDIWNTCWQIATFHFSEIWAQAESLPTSIDGKLAWGGAWEINTGYKTKWLCSRALSIENPKADWWKDQWYYQERLAHSQRSLGIHLKVIWDRADLR